MHIVLGGIGAQQRPAVAVGDGDVEDGRRVAVDRAEQPVQALIVPQHVGDSGAQGCGIVGIELAAAQAIGEREPGAVEDLVRHHVVGGIGLADALGEELLQEEPGQNRHDQKDKSGNGEHKFCLQTHGGQPMVPVTAAPIETGNSAWGWRV